MNLITVLGSSGFIGSHLVKRLEELRIDYFAPSRGDQLSNKKLGHVIYCIGLTADFRTRPFETMEAHVCKLLEVLQCGDFDSLLYLSSTRLYKPNGRTVKEEDSLEVSPLLPGDLYNASKLAGESLALNCGGNGRVVRLSNVYGSDFTSDNFLSTILSEAVCGQEIVFQTSFDSGKDYISIHDAVELLIKIAMSGKHRIYNLASGRNTSNRELAERISALTGCRVRVAPEAAKITFPQVNIDRIRDEFECHPASILEDMKHIVQMYKNHYGGLDD